MVLVIGHCHPWICYSWRDQDVCVWSPFDCQVGLLTGFSVLSVMELLYHLGLLATAISTRRPCWFISSHEILFCIGSEIEEWKLSHVVNYADSELNFPASAQSQLREGFRRRKTRKRSGLLPNPPRTPHPPVWSFLREKNLPIFFFENEPFMRETNSSIGPI